MFNWSNFFGFNKKSDLFTGVQNDISILGNTTPRWININKRNLWNIYSDVPHVAIVINKKARMISTMRIKHLDSNLEEIENSPVLQLLKSPNVLSDGDDFLINMSIAADVYSNVFAYKNLSVVGDLPRALWGLPPELMSLRLTGKSLDQLDIKGIISSYKLDQTNSTGALFGSGREFVPDEIMHIKSNNKVSDSIGTSKLIGLEKPISNIVAAYEARNILINERGAIGILSAEAKDGIPMLDKERKKVSKKLNQKYGITKNRQATIVTTTPLKWQPMNFDAKQLQLFEEVEDDFRTIADTFGMLVDVFSTQDGKTYENQKEALKSTYQNTIMPEGNAFLKEISATLGLTEKNEILFADYSHLPVLQEDRLESDKALEAKTKAMINAALLVDQSKITQDQFNVMFNLM